MTKPSISTLSTALLLGTLAAGCHEQQEEECQPPTVKESLVVGNLTNQHAELLKKLFDIAGKADSAKPSNGGYKFYNEGGDYGAFHVETHTVSPGRTEYYYVDGAESGLISTDDSGKGLFLFRTYGSGVLTNQAGYIYCDSNHVNTSEMKGSNPIYYFEAEIPPCLCDETVDELGENREEADGKFVDVAASK